MKPTLPAGGPGAPSRTSSVPEARHAAPDENAPTAPAGAPRAKLGLRPSASGAERPAADTGARRGVRSRFLPSEAAPQPVSPSPREAAPQPARPPQREAVSQPAKPRAPRSTPLPPRRAAPVSRPAASDSPATQEGVRLSKVMAERGLCSRREADEIIERGWVFVDGRRVSELGTRIDPAAEITLAPQARKRQAEQVTILLHKPVGYVSGQPEPGYAPAVSLIGSDNQFDRALAPPFHPSQLKGLAPAGRLDIDSTGLLVLTQDGRVARQLIGEDSKVEKEYLVRVEGQLDDAGLALLRHGLTLDGRRLRPAQVEWINDDQLRFVLREGRKRQIRRMCELVGLKVVGLKRVRIGRVRLGDLPLGQWRFLREDERFE